MRIIRIEFRVRRELLHMNAVSFGEKIAKLRRKSRLTQKELAELVCVAQSTIAIWESGNNYPRADKLPELARVLGCSISDLYGSEQKGA